MSSHRLVATLLAGLVSVALVAPASADDTIATDQSRNEIYSGVRVVVSIWDGVASAGVYDIEHIGDMEYVSIDGAWLVLGEGSATSGGGGMALAGWSDIALSDKYQVRSAVGKSMLGRTTRMVEVMEGDLVRSKFRFDIRTGAPLSTKIFDGDGELFRSSTMVSFGRANLRLYRELLETGTQDIMMSVALGDALPEKVAGYQVADVYEMNGGGQQVFYSDGLFSFSVFTLAKNTTVSELAEADEVTIGSGKYRRFASPTVVWVTWTAGDVTYVLVGDVPPDHLEAVLAELPKPSRGNFLTRWWGRMFG
ncbi:MAG: hypothetical protein GXP36_13950 [Actinobacteria bacterium]|nr:hypothetical protein [Actinomycetota bacterium]